MLADVVGFLICPVCGESLRAEGNALACDNGHTHDVAREGYVNLLGGHRVPGTADTADMVRARDAFLARGLYEPIADAVAAAVAEAVGAGAVAAPADRAGCVAEIGAGTGYYLARALDALSGRAGVAIDISKHAARRAARAHPRIGAIVADAWARLPLADGCADAVLDVFAPRNAAEIARVLRPGGVLVVVTPTPRHLAELVATLGLVTVDAEKNRRLEQQLSPLFRREIARTVERELVLDRVAVRELVDMGPSARHVEAADIAARLDALPDPVAATLSVTVAVYRLRAG